MTTLSTTVMTTSGIEVVITFVRADQAVVATGEAIPSPLTRGYDASYRRDEQLYFEAAASRGLRDAGDPPLDGAERYLMEIDILPTEAAWRRPNPAVRSLGGSGTEWRVVWTWPSLPTLPLPASFTVRTPTSETAIQLD